MEQRIISNKVYESLQVPSENTRTTTGKILYANRYSGIAQVPMPQDLRALIDSDFGLIGKNILVQLEQKMKGYSNGPWYVDSRDGIIYIHNRKFHEDSVHTYTYQGENGEVLKVTFTLEKITKNVKVTLSPSVDPETKDLEVITSNIDSEIEDETPPISPFISRVDNTQVSNYASHNWEDGRDHPTTPPLLEWSANNALAQNKVWVEREKRLEYQERKKEYDALGPRGAYEAGKQRFLDGMSIENLRYNINSMVGNLPENIRRQVDYILRNSKTGKALEANLKTLLEKEIYLFEKNSSMSFMVTEYVDPLDYDPEHYASKQAGLGVASGVNYKTGIIPASDRGYAALLSDPYTEVYGEMEPDTSKHYGQGQYGKKVKVRHMKQVKLKVPLYKLYHNLFSRYGGADKYAWAANANANGGLKKVEKKLVCNLQVIGRPSLESSQIINLENVGKRWSGLWYIKTCTHSMDVGQGYLTSMELVQNNMRSGSNSARVSLSTETIVANDAKVNSKTDRGKNKKSNNETHLNLDFTYSEKVYFVEAFLDEQGNLRDIKGATEFIRKKAYYTQKYAKDPKALAEGIVTSEGNIYTSEGEFIPGKVHLKNIEVPSTFDIRFNYMKIASRVYREWKTK